MDSNESKLARRGLSGITCRPDAGRRLNGPRNSGSLALRDNATEAGIANPPACNARLRSVKPNWQGVNHRELVMSTKTAQWTMWAFVMFVFTGLTLAAAGSIWRWRMTIAAVLWYGIVPEARSRDNDATGRATSEEMMNTIQSIWHKIYPADHEHQVDAAHLAALHDLVLPRSYWKHASLLHWVVEHARRTVLYLSLPAGLSRASAASETSASS